MVRKLSAILLVLSLVIVAACSNKSAEPTASGAASPAATSGGASTAKPVAQTVIKMLGWKQPTNNAAIEAINKKFEEKYPQYKVEYVTTAPDEEYKQAYRTRVPAGEVDIFADLSAMRLSPQDWTPGAKVPDWQQFIDQGFIADLSNEALVKNYIPEDIAVGGTYKGKVYAIPSGKVVFSGLFYNKDIFAKYNLKVPTTWTEFIALNETLKKNGVTPIAFAGKDKWPIKIFTMGLQAQLLGGGDQNKWIEGLWKGTAKFNDPEPLEVLEKSKIVQDKYSIEGFMGIDYGTLDSYFTSGKVAMMANGVWEAPAIAKAAPNLKFGYFPVPATDDASKNYIAGKYDLTWYVTTKGKNKEGALKWLEFYSQPENYKDFVAATGFLPTQPNIKAGDFLDAEVQPYMSKFKVGYEILLIDRENIGEHIAAEGVHTEYLAPGGPFKTAKELADVQQKEWEAAAPKK